MSEDFARSTTKIGDIKSLPIWTNDINDLFNTVPDDNAYIRLDTTYHCLTDNIKTINGEKPDFTDKENNFTLKTDWLNEDENSSGHVHNKPNYVLPIKYEKDSNEVSLNVGNGLEVNEDGQLYATGEESGNIIMTGIDNKIVNTNGVGSGNFYLLYLGICEFSYTDYNAPFHEIYLSYIKASNGGKDYVKLHGSYDRLANTTLYTANNITDVDMTKENSLTIEYRKNRDSTETTPTTIQRVYVSNDWNSMYGTPFQTIGDNLEVVNGQLNATGEGIKSVIYTGFNNRIVNNGKGVGSGSCFITFLGDANFSSGDDNAPFHELRLVYKKSSDGSTQTVNFIPSTTSPSPTTVVTLYTINNLSDIDLSINNNLTIEIMKRINGSMVRIQSIIPSINWNNLIGTPFQTIGDNLQVVDGQLNALNESYDGVAPIIKLTADKKYGLRYRLLKAPITKRLTLGTDSTDQSYAMGDPVNSFSSYDLTNNILKVYFSNSLVSATTKETNLKIFIKQIKDDVTNDLIIKKSGIENTLKNISLIGDDGIDLTTIEEYVFYEGYILFNRKNSNSSIINGTFKFTLSLSKVENQIDMQYVVTQEYQNVFLDMTPSPI